MIRNYFTLIFIMIHFTCTTMLFLHRQRIIPYRRLIITDIYILILMSSLLYYAPKLFSILTAGDSVFQIMENSEIIIPGILIFFIIRIKDYKESGYILHLQMYEQIDIENWLTNLLNFLSEKNISNEQFSFYVEKQLVSFRFRKVPYKMLKTVKKRLRRKFSDISLASYIIFITILVLGIGIYCFYSLYI